MKITLTLFSLNEKLNTLKERRDLEGAKIQERVSGMDGSIVGVDKRICKRMLLTEFA